MHATVFGVLFALAAAPGTRTPAAVLPPAAYGNDAPLALAIQDRASALLAATGSYNLVHAKQVASMALRHGMSLEDLSDANTARAAAERLGTQRFVFGKLDGHAAGWKLEITAAEVGSPRTQKVLAALPKGWAAAVREGSQAIAQALLTLDGLPVPEPFPAASPQTPSDEGMRLYANCFATLVRQPISVDAPSALNGPELAQARKSCADAVKEDPEFSAAWAALSFARALSGEDEGALAALARIRSDAGFLPLAWVSRFWLVTRYQSNAAGESVLKRALDANPGFLLGRAYLAEFYNALGKQSDAASTWRDYLALSPDNPYVLTRMAYTLSRMGETAAAVKFSQQASAFDPHSVELKLELASRYVDAGQLDKALGVLEPLGQDANATGEVWLRLGYVQLRQGQLDFAQTSFEKAFAKASSPADWRTRARSRYDAALVALKKGDKAKARALLLDAVAQGLHPKPASAEEQTLVALAKPEELVPSKKALPAEASPFPTDSGDIVPEAKKPAPPKGFEAAQKP